MNEKILVLMSTYNGEKYLLEQLDSIKNQSDVECTLLVRDDGSKDATVKLLNKYHAKYADFQIIIMQCKNIGVFKSFINLVKTATSDERFSDFKYFAFADQDDVWLPDKLKLALDVLKSMNDESKPNMYCSNAQLVDAQLNPMKLMWKQDEVDVENTFPVLRNFAVGCTTVFNRTACQMLSENVMEAKSLLHDFNLYLICRYFGKCYYDKNPHILYRQHENNVLGGLYSDLNFFGRWKNRIKNLPQNIKLLFNKNEDSYFVAWAKAVYATLGDKLGETDRILLKKITDYKNNFRSRITVTFSRKICSTSKKDDFIRRAKTLIGIY